MTSGASADPAGLLSIVIATQDRYPFLREAIAAVERQTLDADRFELIIVDNGSDPAAQAAFLRELSVDCRCDYAVEQRPGSSRARNIGMRLAHGDVVAFLDDDAMPDRGWAQAIVDRFAKTAGIGALGGPVEPIWPTERPAWLPRWGDNVLSTLDHGPLPRALARGEWLIGANLAFRKSTLEAVGGFPEALGRRGATLLSNEDLAAVEAVVAGGDIAFYEPRMRVRHHIHRDRLTQAWLRRRMAWQLVSDLLQSNGDLDGEAPGDLAIVGALLGHEGRDGALTKLFDAPDDAGTVDAQMRAVRLLLRLLLAEPTPAGAQP